MTEEQALAKIREGGGKMPPFGRILKGNERALVNFKKEFKEEKNLWDRFLDILAGGTHQSPSERVMLERWIEGEKGDL